MTAVTRHPRHVRQQRRMCHGLKDAQRRGRCRRRQARRMGEIPQPVHQSPRLLRLMTAPAKLNRARRVGVRSTRRFPAGHPIVPFRVPSRPKLTASSACVRSTVPVTTAATRGASFLREPAAKRYRFPVPSRCAWRGEPESGERARSRRLGETGFKTLSREPQSRMPQVYTTGHARP